MEEYRVITGMGGMFGLGMPVSSCGSIYTAYRKGKEPLTQERGRVLFSCDEDGFLKYSRQIGENCVIRISAKKEGSTFRVEKLLEAQAEPLEDEQDFIFRQLLPVTFEDEQFGEFVLDRSINCFSGSITFNSTPIEVLFDEKENLRILRQIYVDFSSFLDKAASFAAEKLLGLGNDWCFDAWEGEDEDFVPMTAEDFARRISLTGISLSEPDLFTLWYDDDDIFWGHSICVEGSLQEGLTDASIQG